MATGNERDPMVLDGVALPRTRLLPALAIGWWAGTSTLCWLAWGVRYTGLLDARTPPTASSTVFGVVLLVWGFSIPVIGLLISMRRRHGAWALTFGVELALSICCGLIYQSGLG